MAQWGPLVSAHGIVDEGVKGQTVPESPGKEVRGMTFLVRSPSLRFPIGNQGCGEIQERHVRGGGCPAVARHRVDPITGPAVPRFGALGLIRCWGQGTHPH